MNTKEMIIELEKDSQKEFIRVRDGLLIKADENGYLRWAEGHNWLNLTDEWEEVKKPVDFMTAFKALRNKNKNIYCIREGIRANYYKDSENPYFFHEDDIDNGKWYIED